MYISGNDLKIYNLILVVFSSIDDSFSCVSRQARRNIWGQWAILLPYSNERGEVYAHQIGMSPFNLKKFCRTFVSGFVCLTRKADATMRKIRNREFVKQSLAKGGEFS